MIKLDYTNFNYYGLLLFISVVLGIILIDIDLKKIKISKEHILFYDLIIFVFTFTFGIILTIIESLLFKQKISIGFSSYGGLIGFIISTFLFSKIFKYNFKFIIKIIITKIPLIYSISKIGCFLSGCCYGIEYSGFGNVIYISSNSAPINTKLFPIQLVETIVFMIIFITLYIYNKKHKKYVLPLTLISCGISKYLLEFLRHSHTTFITFTQSISLIIVFIGIYLLLKERNNYERIK